LRKRKWDTDKARELLELGHPDTYVADQVGSTLYAIRIFRLQEQHKRENSHKRRYEISGENDDREKGNYQQELRDFITKKAAEAAVTYDDYKRWLFHTKEGIIYCHWMNRQLSGREDINFDDQIFPKKITK